MFSRILTPGDKIEIIRISSPESGNTGGGYYVSQLLDISEDNKISIAMPITHGRVIPLDVGEKYLLCFYTQNGLFQSKGIIVERYRSENQYIAIVRFTSDLEKFQRRQFYRLEYIFDFTFRTISEKENAVFDQLHRKEYATEAEKKNWMNFLFLEQSPWLQGTGTDISGGGIRFNSARLDDNVRYIYAHLKKNNVFDITTRARIIYSGEIPNRPELYEYRAEFIGIDTKDRETIVRFIFDEERKRRKQEKE